MFQLYTTILSVNANYAWNKIIHKQTAPDPYTDIQSCSKKGPRGLLRKSSDDCVMFSNNTAEQEQYNITNVPKKP
jgi:hypothetical protein